MAHLLDLGQIAPVFCQSISLWMVTYMMGSQIPWSHAYCSPPLLYNDNESFGPVQFYVGSHVYGSDSF